MLADDAVERREHRGVAQVRLGDREIALGILDIGPRIVALGLGLSKVACAETFWRSSVSWRVNSASAWASEALAPSSWASASLTLALYIVCSMPKSLSSFFFSEPST